MIVIVTALELTLLYLYYVISDYTRAMIYMLLIELICISIGFSIYFIGIFIQKVYRSIREKTNKIYSKK